MSTAQRAQLALFSFGVPVLLGSVYLFVRSAVKAAPGWMVLGIGVLCLQGVLVLGMLAYAIRFGVRPRNRALMAVSSALTWLGLLLILAPMFGPRVLAAIR